MMRKITIERIMALIQIRRSNCIVFYVGQQGVPSDEVGAMVPVFENSTIEPKPNLLGFKYIFSIATFNVRTLNTI